MISLYYTDCILSVNEYLIGEKSQLNTYLNKYSYSE